MIALSACSIKGLEKVAFRASYGLHKKGVSAASEAYAMTINPPVFVTSLAPRGRPGAQEQAIASWLSLNARVISVNTDEEISLLSPQFPGITFATLTRTAQAEAGRPVPYLDDLLAVCAKESTANQAPLLINADIVLAPRPDSLQKILDVAQAGTLICGARVDVDDVAQAQRALSGGQPVSGEISGGYDYFAIPQPFLDLLTSRLTDSRLALGMPFWDYWLPLAALLAGTPTTAVEVPFALHGRHGSDWDQTKFVFFKLFVEALLRQMAPPPGQRLGASLQQSLLWQMVRFEHDKLIEAAAASPSTSPEGQAAQTALADFYDRQFAVFVHHIRTLTPPLDFSA
jgi:hypothetical protein